MYTEREKRVQLSLRGLDKNGIFFDPRSKDYGFQNLLIELFAPFYFLDRSLPRLSLYGDPINLCQEEDMKNGKVRSTLLTCS